MGNEYYTFIDKIYQKLGINLRLYKENQMKRRLTSLRNKRGFTSFATYYNALQTDEKLLDEFIDRLTINVTEFYRNPKRWRVLEKIVFPKLLQKSRSLNIWSAACSTGEEPYSLALMLSEHFPDVSYQILATDLDEKALEKAKEGQYISRSLKDLPKFMKHKHFTKEGSFYTINSALKKHITFKKHDLLKDPYPKHMDLIVCRNVLIYFTDEAKQTIYEKFSQSLKEEGVLFVGSTEQIFNPAQYRLKVLETFFYEKY